MSRIRDVINSISSSSFGGAVSYTHDIDARPAQTTPLSTVHSPLLRQALESRGITELYTHQAAAYEAAMNGDNVIITTPTSSGKTLCYNLPVLEDILSGSAVSRALYFFPLKALGHDQKRTLDALINAIPVGGDIRTAILDGDVDKKHRRKMQADPPDIIITNPDILHYAVMAGLSNWHDTLATVKTIVVDELHTYRGVFGSHIHNLFARFLRLYPDVRIIAASATIENPASFAEDLFGRPFTHIGENGAPSGKKQFVMFNPELPPAAISAHLMKRNIDAGLSTICFTKSRRQTETIYQRILRSDPAASSAVSSYRAGFLPEERRQIEESLQTGKLKGVVATSAFELGIDIGGIDSTILVGYPGSMMSLWQRAGRSGRGVKDALIMLVAGADALDQYYVKHPEMLVSGRFEEITVDTDNDEISAAHVVCAAAESPIRMDEPYAATRKKLIDTLVRDAKLFLDAGGDSVHGIGVYPHKNIDLRMAGDSYTITAHGTLIGTTSGRRAYTESFPGAVYLHRGASFVVESVDAAKQEIKVKPFEGGYYTIALTEKQTIVLEEVNRVDENPVRGAFCRLRVTEKLTGYQKISTRTGEKIDTIPLDMDPIEFETKGFYLRIASRISDDFSTEGLPFMGAIHALEHAMIALVPTFVLADRADIGGISYPMHPQLASPAVFIYDGHAGGSGITKRMFPRMQELVERTRTLVADCACETGCPACIYSPKCGSGNYPLDKTGCEKLAGLILSGVQDDVSADTAPPPAAKPKTASVPAVAGEPTNEVLVFDIETQRSAEDVGGWNKAGDMGISACVVYSFDADAYTAYTENDLEPLFRRLTNSRALIGYNIAKFDISVLLGSGMPRLSRSVMVFDMLADIYGITKRRFSLDNVAGPTLNTAKSADGLQALAWYREGRIDEIVRYCEMDVRITKDVLMFGSQQGHVLGRMKQTGSVVRIPVLWREVLSGLGIP